MHCSGFGELALLYSAPRAATVVAAADCRLFVMQRAVYLAIKHAHALQSAAAKRILVAAVPMLAPLSQVRLPPPLNQHGQCSSAEFAVS